MFLLPSALALPEARLRPLAVMAPGEGPAGQLCLSTANDIKTAACNVGCNSNLQHVCPQSCLCQKADNVTMACAAC